MSRKALESRSLVQRLSPIELEVLRRIIAGEALATIAIHLKLGEGEARQHRESMMLKLGAKDTADAVRIGIYAAADDQS